DHFAIPNFTVFLFRSDAAMGDALHAVRALLHDAAAAHADLRIAHHLELRGFKVLEEQEIEAAHLVRTVVGAIPRSDAAVVHHVVQAFGAMDRGADRTNHFARRVLALLTRNRLVVNRRISGATLVVHIHPQPLHLSATHGLLLAYDGDIVLRLASHDAGFAANARVHVDGHAPLQLRVLVVVVERHFRRGRLDSFVREVGVLDEVLQGRFADDVTVTERLGTIGQVGMVDVLKALRVGEPVSCTDFADTGSPTRKAFSTST